MLKKASDILSSREKNKYSKFKTLELLNLIPGTVLSRTDLRKYSLGLFQEIEKRNHNLLDVFYPSKKKKDNTKYKELSLEKIIKSLPKDIITRSQLKFRFNKAYNELEKRGVLDELFPLLRKESLDYREIKTSDLLNNIPSEIISRTDLRKYDLKLLEELNYRNPQLLETFFPFKKKGKTAINYETMDLDNIVMSIPGDVKTRTNLRQRRPKLLKFLEEKYPFLLEELYPSLKKKSFDEIKSKEYIGGVEYKSLVEVSKSLSGRIRFMRENHSRTNQAPLTPKQISKKRFRGVYIPTSLEDKLRNNLSKKIERFDEEVSLEYVNDVVKSLEKDNLWLERMFKKSQDEKERGLQFIIYYELMSEFKPEAVDMLTKSLTKQLGYFPTKEEANKMYLN